jgi:curved DNA-binding protein CbpA
MEKSSHYQILGASITAPQKEIARAYRRLARRFHPDLQPPERKAWAEEQMKRLNEAYAVLGDPAARRRYDATLGLPVSIPPIRKKPASKQRRFMETANLASWIAATGFLVIGVFLFTVVWTPMFAPSARAEDFAGQWLFFFAWFTVLMATLLRIIPMRR